MVALESWPAFYRVTQSDKASVSPDDAPSLPVPVIAATTARIWLARECEAGRRNLRGLCVAQNAPIMIAASRAVVKM